MSEGQSLWRVGEYSLPEGDFTSRTWPRFLRGPDPRLLEDLYVPALQRSVRYDRCCAYFSSSVLSTAARGFSGLISRFATRDNSLPRPAVRLLVNEQLSREDVEALSDTPDTAALERILMKRFSSPESALEKARLEMLAWLVSRELVEIRVGILRHGEGILHAKFGLFYDENGNALVFSGSGNESRSGLTANYEHLEVTGSWGDQERYQEFAEEFERLWEGSHPDVMVVRLPEAIRQGIISYAPDMPPLEEPLPPKDISDDLKRKKLAMQWKFIVESPYMENGETACEATMNVSLWPHQRAVVQEVLSAWPKGKLLCDEVGMGKTIEAIAALRRLLAGRGVKRALFLLPAGLVLQWQDELREKGNILAPRFESQRIVWPDGSSRAVSGFSEALEEPMLLISRELARIEANQALLLDGPSWDLVILDEAHAARRKKQEEGEFNTGTLLLDLVRRLQIRGKTASYMFLSATPMQTHPWEPWDLLGTLGVGGAWIAEFDIVRQYYSVIQNLEGSQEPSQLDLKFLYRTVMLDPDLPISPEGPIPEREEDFIDRLIFADEKGMRGYASWMRKVSPLGRRMLRNGKETLQKYYRDGLLEAAPPRRIVQDIRYRYEDAREGRVYNAIKDYIDSRFQALEREKRGKGFVMTVYRRRCTSSLFALEKSLLRRKEGLRQVIERGSWDPYLEDESLDWLDLEEVEGIAEGGKISSAFPEDPVVAAQELQQVEFLLSEIRELPGIDTKRDRFTEELRRLQDEGRSVLVFTEYTDTMDFLKDWLSPLYGKELATFCGRGGERWDGKRWVSVTKDAITASLQNGELRVLLCTDAASEGLNLQKAGAVINYDLPWNPSKVEQRIGRIDRIGQSWPEVKVINMFLRDSIDDRVYKVLRERCRLFEHFVGPMQPVLAKAQKILLGQTEEDLFDLTLEAERIETDFLAAETYRLSDPEVVVSEQSPIKRENLVDAMLALDNVSGISVSTRLDKISLRLPDGTRREYATGLEALEADDRLHPLSPTDPFLTGLHQYLYPDGNLPLTCIPFEKGSFKRASMFWIDGDGNVMPVRNLEELNSLLEAWDGSGPATIDLSEIQTEVRDMVEKIFSIAEERRISDLKAQKDACTMRLKMELGRFLLSLDPNLRSVEGINGLFYKEMEKGGPRSARLKKCFEKLGGYPDWDIPTINRLREQIQRIDRGHREARLLGNEIDAALNDPRWEVKTS